MPNKESLPTVEELKAREKRIREAMGVYGDY